MSDTLYTIQESTLTDIADAVRSKKGTSSPIAVTDLADTIASIDGSQPIELKMTFKNNTPSIAYGEIVLSAKEAEYSGNYDIMWGDANGVMSNYSKIDTLTLDVANNKTMASIELMEYNAIPKYATRLCAVQNGTIVTSFNIPSAKLWDDEYYGEHDYSTLNISDIHIQYETAEADTIEALDYGKTKESVVAVVGAGDLTSNGTVSNLEEWKTVRDTYRGNTPVHMCNGNHEAKNSASIMYSNKASIRKYLDTDWQEGDDTTAYFLKEIEEDIYIFLSIFEDTQQGYGNIMFTSAELTWLEEKLELYRNRRVFLFAHVPPHWNTSGIAYDGFGLGNGAYSYEIWGNPQVKNQPLSDRTAFLNLLEHYKNVIWFSGHSHIKYEYQKRWQDLNVIQFRGGARLVHLSSLTVPRDIVDGSVSDYMYAESEGTLMDVYPNHIRLRSRNFVSEKFYGLCEYIIDTTPVTIPPKSKTLVSISATKAKTSYYTDETLSTADITVTATWSDSTTSVVDNNDVVFDTSNVTLATEGTYTIGISYTYGEDTETTSVQVTSVERPSVKTLSTISATKTVTAYVVNDTLTTNDIVVTATYSDNTTADVTASAQYDTSNVDMTTAGAYTIVVSYTEDSVNKTTTVGITVSSGSVSPTVVLDAVYEGTLSAQGEYVINPTMNVGSKGTGSNSGIAYTNNGDMQGKTLYYRLLSDVGISKANKVGFRCYVASSYSASDTSHKVENYSLDATDWTKLTYESDGSDFKTTSSLSTLVVKCQSSSSSTATFPVAINARLQIGYMNS